MLVFFQFPIVDFRYLLANGGKRLTLPRYNRGNDKSYVTLPHFGRAGKRQINSPAFDDEWAFYNAHRSVHFMGLGRRIFERQGTEYKRDVSLTRRLFNNDPHRVSAHVEFKLSIQAEKPLEFEFEALKNLLNTVLNLPTKFTPIAPSDNEESSISSKTQFKPLHLLGKELAELYAIVTSPITDYLFTELVQTCESPVLVIEFEHGEIALNKILSDNNPYYFNPLNYNSTLGVEAWYGKFPTSKDHVIPCWLLTPGRGSKKDRQNLRRLILRLHSEHEVLHKVLIQLDKNPNIPYRYELKDYLGYINRKFFNSREQLGQFKKLAILNAIFAISPKNIKDRLAPALRKKYVHLPLDSPPPKLSLAWKKWIVKLDPKPDLTVIIQKGDGKLWWSFYSGDLRVKVPDNAIDVEVGDISIASICKNIATDRKNFLFRLRGVGITIGKAIPQMLWELLEQIRKKKLDNENKRPSMLILSEETDIPWELAVLDDEAPFLAAMANVGRWLLPDYNKQEKFFYPPSEIVINNATLFSGSYKTSTIANELEGAIAETGYINENFKKYFSINSIDANTNDVRRYFEENRQGRLLHFALHGYFDPRHTGNGMLMTDDNFIDPLEILGKQHLKNNPFVFLNACSVGMSHMILNSVVGMSESFLKIGASSVIAPLWEVDDKNSFEMTKSFYDTVLNKTEGVSLVADFFSEQYVNFDESVESFSTYLAYRFYGHPALRLVINERNNDRP